MRRGAALRTVALAGLAVLTILPTFPLKGQEVGSATVVPIQVTGDPEVRFSMVVLGDGYTAGEQERFREHLDKHLNVLWSIEPFRSYRSYINVYAVAEFRVNGDGWHHYYGWPDAPLGTPYLFTPRGTNIKELIYGSLSSEGLSPQPWEPREPGWGTHRIEYRAMDAAGNISEAGEFLVTISPGPGSQGP